MEENPYKAPVATDASVVPQNERRRQSTARRLVVLLLLVCVGAIITALFDRLVFAMLPSA